MPEKSLATPDCVQSLPTKGMNWPKTSDLKKREKEGFYNDSKTITQPSLQILL